ncbi:MAG: hypothetical protein ACKVT0_16465 [Planctomycetaceae bacterium]
MTPLHRSFIRPGVPTAYFKLSIALIVSAMFSAVTVAQDANEPKKDKAAATSKQKSTKSKSPGEKLAAGLTVRDVQIWVATPQAELWNAQSYVYNGFPDFIASKRKPPRVKETEGESSLDRNRHPPSPIGFITFEGPLPETLDVVLKGNDVNNFYCTWPKARIRTRRIEWMNVTEPSATNENSDIAEKYPAWLAAVQNDPSRQLLPKARGRGLLYDLELKKPLAVKISKNGEQYFIGNLTDHPLSDVAFIQSQKDKTWRVGHFDRLETVPADQRPKASDDSAEQKSFGQPLSWKEKTYREVTDIFEEWKPQFAAWGLGESEGQVIADVLSHWTASQTFGVCIYRMDPEALEAMLPLEVLPGPEKLVRVGIVIVIHADPEIAADVDQLILQLGDPKWAQREMATKALRRIGVQARDKLKKAKSHDDAEIVFRSEQLLREFEAGTKPDEGDGVNELNLIIR